MTRIAKLLTLILLMGVFGNIAIAQGVDEDEPAVTEAIDAATAGQAGEDDAALAPSDLVRPKIKLGVNAVADWSSANRNMPPIFWVSPFSTP